MSLYLSVQIVKDGFTETNIVTLSSPKVVGYFNIINTDFDLFFFFKNESGKHHIIFRYYQKNLRINIGDKISFLFEDNRILEFIINNKEYRADKTNEGIIHEVVHEISEDDLTYFLNYKLHQCKIDFINKQNLLGNIESKYEKLEEKQRRIIGNTKSYYDSCKMMTVE